MSYKDKKYQSLIIGSTSDYSRVWSWPVIQGSDFTDEDVRGLRNVGLIGQFLAKELFGADDPVGKTILVRRIPVQIVGVLSERGTTPAGERLDDRIVMPITTLMRKLQNETKYVSAMSIRFLDQENLSVYVNEMKSFLRKRHKLPPEEPDDFMIVSPREIVKFLVALTGSLERALVAAELKETLHAAEQASITRAIMVESDIKDLATRVLALERQVAINTGILTEHQKER